MPERCQNSHNSVRPGKAYGWHSMRKQKREAKLDEWKLRKMWFRWLQTLVRNQRKDCHWLISIRGSSEWSMSQSWEVGDLQSRGGNLQKTPGLSGSTLSQPVKWKRRTFWHGANLLVSVSKVSTSNHYVTQHNTRKRVPCSKFKPKNWGT